MTTMESNGELEEIGEALVEDSRQTEFGGRRGVVEDLWPYIYYASKRMSARAISRALGARGVKLSAQTVAKALREEKKHWAAFLERFEPAARVMAENHGRSMAWVLWLDKAAFEYYANNVGPIAAVSVEAIPEKQREYEDAVLGLEPWFDLDIETRGTCLAALGIRVREVEEGKGGSGKKQKRSKRE